MMSISCRKTPMFGAWTVLVLGLVVAAPASSRAGVTLDLTGNVITSGSINGGYFFQANPKATGTGNLDAFLQIGQQGASNNPVERAYNSDVTEFQTGASSTHNHSVGLNTVPFVTFSSNLTLGDGSILAAGQYYEFIFDVNQQDNKGGTALSLSELQVFASNDHNLTSYDLMNHNFGANATLVYDMGGRVTGDQVGDGSTATRDPNGNLIALDYGVSSGGSGHGDMAFYLPVAAFAAYNQATTFVTLSNVIGLPNANNDGFEEWGFVREREGGIVVTATTPEPSTLITGGMACLICLGYSWRRRRSRLAA